MPVLCSGDDTGSREPCHAGGGNEAVLLWRTCVCNRQRGRKARLCHGERTDLNKKFSVAWERPDRNFSASPLLLPGFHTKRKIQRQMPP